MKVLQIIPHYLPAFQYGGPIHSVHIISRAMVDKGIDVTVWTTKLGLKNRDDIPSGKEVLIDGVRVCYFPIVGSFHYSLSAALMKYMNDGIKDFDVIHIQGVYQFHSLIGGYYARKYGIPYVLSPRGMLLPEFIKMKGRIKKFLYINLVEKKNLENADFIHCTTEDERKGLINLGFKQMKIIVIPNGIENEGLKRISDSITFRKKYNLNGKLIILFLGRLIWSKGFDLLIPAFAKVVKKYKNAHLIIAGPDSKGYKSKITKWIKQNGIEEFVTFTGFLEGEEKLYALYESDIFIQPSYSESFGMATVEAMMAGLPVVISNKVGICDVVERDKCGMIVDLTFERIAEGICYLLDNPEERKYLGNRAKETAKREFSIQVVAERMIKAYKSVVESRKKTSLESIVMSQQSES